MYMDFRYEGGTHSTTNQSEPDLVLTYGADGGTPGSLDTLLAWHNADPPSNPNSTAPLDNIEVLRNDTIQLIQHNRNPLIDHPEWAAIIFAKARGAMVTAMDRRQDRLAFTVEALGAEPGRVFVRHVLPHALGPVLVAATIAEVIDEAS